MSGESAIAGPAETPCDAAARARLDWVDALKGIGIVAVVAGHVWTRGPVRDAIYAVHMPLFFILSGYTARHVPWRVLLPGCLRGLGLPFLCFSILLLGADFLIEGLRGVRPVFADWRQGAATILLATERLRGPFTILWFIPALLMARLAWNALVAGGRRADSRLVLAAMALLLVLALLAHRFGTRSPFALLAVPGALLMMWAGALWRLRGPPPRGLAVLLALLALLAVTWLPPVNMKAGDLGWPLLSLAGAAGATVTLAALARRLPPALAGGLAELGRASLVVMYVHVAFVHYLAPHAPAAVRFAAALGASWALDRLVRRTALTRRLLLGEAPKTAH